MVTESPALSVPMLRLVMPTPVPFVVGPSLRTGAPRRFLDESSRVWMGAASSGVVALSAVLAGAPQAGLAAAVLGATVVAAAALGAVRGRPMNGRSVTPPPKALLDLASSLATAGAPTITAPMKPSEPPPPTGPAGGVAQVTP